MTDVPSEIAFSASDISKSFPGVKALSSVDFTVKRGQVHALVGENGAGKSTLVKIIAGLQLADSGQMTINGTNFAPSGRKDAESCGVRIVMQELNLINNLTVSENIFLEKLPSKFGFVNYPELNAAAKVLTQQVGLSVEPNTKISQLGVGQQQMVEIAAGLSQNCDILILDEPTASLTDKETELLFIQIERLKNSGVSIIYISHHIDEIMRIADRVTILRDGKLVFTGVTSKLTAEKIVSKMVGRDLEYSKLRHETKTGQIALRAEGLTRGKKVRNVSFQVHCAEILGIAGLMG
jgi:ribose transport system ATP-binding protein